MRASFSRVRRLPPKGSAGNTPEKSWNVFSARPNTDPRQKARNVDDVPLNAAEILKQEGSVAKVNLDAELRKAIRQETELFFDHIARSDRSLLELIDSDYTFLNEPLANFYGIPDIKGKEM